MSYHYVHIEDSQTLTLQEGDDLRCAADEVVIDVAFAGINRRRQTRAQSWDSRFPVLFGTEAPTVVLLKENLSVPWCMAGLRHADDCKSGMHTAHTRGH